MKMTMKRKAWKMDYVNDDVYFEYEDSLRELFASIGGVPKNFGKFELEIAEYAARMRPEVNSDDGMAFVLSVYEKLNALRGIYTAIRGDSEGFWDFLAKVAEITGGVVPQESDEEDGVDEE